MKWQKAVSRVPPPREVPGHLLSFQQQVSAQPGALKNICALSFPHPVILNRTSLYNTLSTPFHSKNRGKGAQKQMSGFHPNIGGFKEPREREIRVQGKGST